jgi:acetyl esterase/lipase
VSWQSGLCAAAVRCALQARMARLGFPESAVLLDRTLERGASLLPLPRHVRVAPASVGGVPCQWVDAADPHGAPVIVYLHGGAFVAGSARTHRDTAWRLSHASGARVLLVEYRLAPSHPFPAALLDAISAYEGLLAAGVPAQSIALAGDSAGGNLALAAAIGLRSLGAPSPAAIACFSPWVDLTLSGDAPRDGRGGESMLTRGFLRAAARAYAGRESLQDPRVSPLFACLEGLPPLLLHAASGELLLDDSRRLQQRARAAGVPSVLRAWPGQLHAFPTFASVVPEARAALAETAAFLAGHLAPRAAALSSGRDSVLS